MAGFVQILEIKTSDFGKVEAFAQNMKEERGDGLLATRSTITADRDRPGTYLVLVEFDSYEQAMKNSNDPETAKWAEQLGALLDGPPRFYNLDVRFVM